MDTSLSAAELGEDLEGRWGGLDSHGGEEILLHRTVPQAQDSLPSILPWFAHQTPLLTPSGLGSADIHPVPPSAPASGQAGEGAGSQTKVLSPRSLSRRQALLHPGERAGAAAPGQSAHAGDVRQGKGPL